MRKIDVHAHAFTPAYMQTMRNSLVRPPDIRSNWEWDEKRFLGEMDRWDVDLQVLSLPHTYAYAEDERTMVDLCRIANDEYAEICARSTDRFKMFALVPLVDPDRACRELERVMGCPGFSGITLGTNIGGRELDDPSLSSFFEFADPYRLLVFLHPLWRSLPEAWCAYRLDHLIGLPAETTFTVSRLALGGFFDRYPNLRLIAAHVGGALPYLSPRIERAYREGRSKHEPSHYFKEILYDTSGPTHEAILACVAKMFGTDRIVFGTDYPFGLGQQGKQYVEHAVWVVEQSGLDEAALKQIFSDNVRPLLA